MLADVEARHVPYRGKILGVANDQRRQPPPTAMGKEVLAFLGHASNVRRQPRRLGRPGEMMRISRLMAYSAAAMVSCVALAVPPASATTPSARTAAVLGSVSPAHVPNDDDAVLRAALNAVVDAGATGAV